MADQAEVVTPDEGHAAHVPVAANGKAFCGTVKDRTNPYSVWSVSPAKLRDAIDLTSEDFYLLDEQVLAKMVGPDARIRLLRISFQREYERVISYYQRTGMLGLMKMSLIYGGICTQVAFDKLIARPLVMTYLTVPLADYFDSLGALQMQMLQRYQEILNAPILDKNGDLHVGRARLVLEAIRGIEDRVLGKAVQRISSENKSVQVVVPHTDRTMLQTTDMMLDMERRIKELTSELYGVRQLAEGDQRGKAKTAAERSPENLIANIEAHRPGWTERKVKAMEGRVRDAQDEPEGLSGAAEEVGGTGGEGHSSE